MLTISACGSAPSAVPFGLSKNRVSLWPAWGGFASLPALRMVKSIFLWGRGGVKVISSFTDFPSYNAKALNVQPLSGSRPGQGISQTPPPEGRSFSKERKCPPASSMRKRKSKEPAKGFPIAKRTPRTPFLSRRTSSAFRKKSVTSSPHFSTRIFFVAYNVFPLGATAEKIR